jgi:hypothetical protein
MGTYDSDVRPFLNPIKTITTVATLYQNNVDTYHNYMDTHNVGAGYIGEIAWI